MYHYIVFLLLLATSLCGVDTWTDSGNSTITLNDGTGSIVIHIWGTTPDQGRSGPCAQVTVIPYQDFGYAFADYGHGNGWTYGLYPNADNYLAYGGAPVGWTDVLLGMAQCWEAAGETQAGMDQYFQNNFETGTFTPNSDNFTEGQTFSGSSTAPAVEVRGDYTSTTAPVFVQLTDAQFHSLIFMLSTVALATSWLCGMFIWFMIIKIKAMKNPLW